MGFAAALLPMLAAGAATAVVGKVLAPKAPKAQAQAVIPQVQVRQNSAVADALAGRRGSRANMRTGPRGAEAPGGKTKLGQ